MLINTYYKELILNHPDLGNEEYLSWQIWCMGQLFINEMAIIKNNRCEFIALTDKVLAEFDLTADILGQTVDHATSLPDKIRAEIYKQELQIFRDRKAQFSFYFYHKGNEMRNYLVKKRLLVNPATDDAVGILINSERVCPSVHRKFINREFLGLSSQILKQDQKLEELIPIHQQILFCLLIGINNRKEIAHTLTSITTKYISENQVKNALQYLYTQFSCSSSSQLINLVLSEQIPLAIPENTIPPGNYLI